MRPASHNTNSMIGRIRLFPQTRTKTRHVIIVIKLATLPRNVARSNVTRLLVSLPILKPQKEKGANLSQKVKVMAAREKINQTTGKQKVPIGVTTAKLRPTLLITAVLSLRLTMQMPMVEEKRDQRPNQRVRANLLARVKDGYLATFPATTLERTPTLPQIPILIMPNATGDLGTYKTLGIRTVT
jgi:hypothetical protein